MHIGHEEDADGPFLLGGQRLAELGRGLAHDDAVERALGVILARLVVEDQDDLVSDVQALVIVMAVFGGTDAESGESDLARRFLAGGAES